jgi:adenylate kinase
MRIVLLGAPGAGKGTQARLMAESYKVPHISTGEILRAAVAEKSPLGKKIAGIMKSGDLVSDDIVIDAVVNKLRRPESRRGFILDGFPRNIPQAQELDTRLGWVGRQLQLAIHFVLDPNVLVKRITGRIVCGDCGAIYNRHFSQPEKRGVCDQCNARNLGQRSDDNEKSVRRRLEAYENETAPLITYYKAQHKLRTLPAEGAEQKIFRFLCEVVDVEIRPLEKKVIPEELRRKSRSEVVPQIRGGSIAAGQISSRASETSARTPVSSLVGTIASRKKAAKAGSAKKRTVKKSTTKKTKAKKKTITRKSLPKPASRKKAAKAGSAKKRTVKKSTTKKTKAKKKTITRKSLPKPASRKKAAKAGSAKKRTVKKSTTKKTKAKKATKNR